MRAASREAYAAAADVLTNISAERDPQALATAGDELLAVARLLDREPGLRDRKSVV